MIKLLQVNTVGCFRTDYCLENVDIEVLLEIGVWDIRNYSTFHSEFGGPFCSSVLNTFQCNEKCYPP